MSHFRAELGLGRSPGREGAAGERPPACSAGSRKLSPGAPLPTGLHPVGGCRGLGGGHRARLGHLTLTEPQPPRCRPRAGLRGGGRAWESSGNHLIPTCRPRGPTPTRSPTSGTAGPRGPGSPVQDEEAWSQDVLGAGGNREGPIVPVTPSYS